MFVQHFLHGLGTESAEYLDMTSGGVFVHCTVVAGKSILDRIFSASFTRAINYVAEDEWEKDLLQQVMATTLEEELSLPCIDDVAGYLSVADEVAEFQDLEQEVKPKTYPIELKQLPPGLSYVFLNDDSETPVIISDKLLNDKTWRLVATLEKYRSVVGYSLKDLKVISLSLCTHCITMEQDHKPVRKHQRQLNNAMREVVKEVLKLLKAGVIYAISDTEGVSPVQVVLKKGGITIIRNEKKELNP
jgi:DNA integrity scanning protein DisA with diadenylate cyclase activity